MPADRGPATSGVTIIFTVISTVFVAARFFTRTYIVKSVKRDDWWILAAWLVAVGFSVSICVGVRYGLGRHKADIPDDLYAMFRKAEYAFSVLYNPSLMLTKTSILVFFLSVMSKDADAVFKWCNWLTLAVVNIAGLALTLLTIFQCRPVDAGYEYPTPENAKCTDIVTLYLSSAPVNIVTDLALLFLPMPILTGMRLPRKQKIILIITFSFGGFVAVVDVIRIAYLQNAALNRLKLVNGTAGSGGQIIETSDFSWDASLSFMWSAVEVHLGIICACVPSLKPLFLRFLPSFIRDVDDEFSSTDSVDYGKTNANEPSPVATRRNTTVLNNPAAFRKPSVQEYSGEDQGDNMGFLNMLAGPDDDAPDAHRTNTRLSRASTRASTRSVVSDFGFVKMSGSKNMLKLTNRQSIWPIGVVTIIFFLWGFAYGLLDTLNGQFQKVVNISTGEALGLHAAYFGGYLAGPLTLGNFIMKRYGFKASMMAGLCVYGCGTLVFWPSAVLTSYTAFIISNFIVAFGLSCLEIAANPYIALCGPMEYAEVRLNFSQAFQAVGTVCSPLLASKVLFKNVLNAPSLVNVQWTYLGIALFVIALAVVFYYIPLPEATDEQLEEVADRRTAVYRAKVGPFQVIFVTLALGVFSQWCYVGLQEAIGGNTQTLMPVLKPNSKLVPFDFSTIGHSVFAVGRFLSAFLNYIITPRWLLLALYVGLIITCGLQMGLKGTPGTTNQMLIYLFESGIFSIIFAIAMRGMGAHTKTASALMTAAISGGAVFPVVQWAVANNHGIQYSYCVPLAVGVFGMIFPVYLCLVPAARRQVDPIHEQHGTPRIGTREFREDGTLSPEPPMVEKFGLAGILARRKQHHRSESPTIEHVEQKGRSESPVWATGPSDPTEVSEIDFAHTNYTNSAAALRGPQGHVGELAPWPAEEEKSRRFSDDISPHQSTIVSARHLEEKDKGPEDEYHTALKSL